jgi:hypothetical protein
VPTAYPPEPWDLRGQMYLSVFAVPRSALPALPPPLAATVRPVGRRVPVGAAWVSYEPGGVLTYRELLTAVLVHERGRPRVSILDIWVDSVASRDGGRALWGIPKNLAQLTIRPGAGTGTLTAANTDAVPGAHPDAEPAAHTGAVPTAHAGAMPATHAHAEAGDTARPIGVASFRAGLRLPGRWPVGMTVVQALGGGVRRTPVRGWADVRLGSATWRVDAHGPLGYLAGRRPIATATLADFRLRFGAAPR